MSGDDRSAVHGVMLQTPLPPGVEFTEVATRSARPSRPSSNDKE